MMSSRIGRVPSARGDVEALRLDAFDDKETRGQGTVGKGELHRWGFEYQLYNYL